MKEGIRLYLEKKYDQALKELLGLKVGSDEYPELSYYLGLCYTQLGRFDEAVLYLEQVVTSDLGFAHVYQTRMILGYIYAVTGRQRLAEFEFGKLLEDGYESPKVYAALAYVSYSQNKVPQALRQLEKALEIDPDNANALNSIGYVLADQGMRLGTALNYCKRAVAMRPANPAYLDSLAWCYYRTGKRKEAIELLRRALVYAPKNPDIQKHFHAITGRMPPQPPTAGSAGRTRATTTIRRTPRRPGEEIG